MAAPSKVNRDFIEPDVLTKIVKNKLAQMEFNNPSSLAPYLPSMEVDDVEYNIDVQTNSQVTAATWRAFGGATTSEVWGEGEKARGRLMPLARNYTIDEETLLRQRNNPKGNPIARRAEDFATRGAEAIALQINLQRANAIVNGKVDILGSGGLGTTVDFGRKPEFNATATNLWTSADHDPLLEIDKAVQMYEDENGFTPEKILIPKVLYRMLVRHPKIVKEAVANPNKTRATRGQVQDLLADLDLPELEVMEKATVKVDDLEKRDGSTKIVNLFPQDKIILAPKAADPRDPRASIYGRTLWGTTASADLKEFRNVDGRSVPGVVAALIHEGWPASMEVIVDALAMPVVFNPNYTLTLKVV